MPSVSVTSLCQVVWSSPPPLLSPKPSPGPSSNLFWWNSVQIHLFYAIRSQRLLEKKKRRKKTKTMQPFTINRWTTEPRHTHASVSRHRQTFTGTTSAKPIPKWKHRMKAEAFISAAPPPKPTEPLDCFEEAWRLTPHLVKEWTYKASIRPILEYSCSVWDPCTIKYIRRLVRHR